MFIKKFHISHKSSDYYVDDYSNFGEEKFIHDFSEIDWSPLDDMSSTADNNFDYLYSKITSCIESHVPKKKVTRRNLKLRTKPWMGSKIQKLMCLRDKFFYKPNSNPTPFNKYLYRKFRNRVVAEQRQSKIRYFQNYFEKYKTNMKMLRSGIRSIVNAKNKNNIPQISQRLKDGSRITDPTKMANIFNQYFINAGSNVDKSVPRTKESPLPYLKGRNPASLFLAPVTSEEIEIIINSSDKNTSTSPCSIPVFILKVL